RHLALAAFGKALVDLCHPVRVRSADRDGDVLANLGGVVRVAVGADDPGAVGFEPRYRDPAAVLLQVDLSAQHTLVELHGLSRVTLEVDIRAEILLAQSDLLVTSVGVGSSVS